MPKTSQMDKEEYITCQDSFGPRERRGRILGCFGVGGQESDAGIGGGAKLRTTKMELGGFESAKRWIPTVTNRINNPRARDERDGS